MARVLVVDDDPIHRELVQVMLERGGHEALTAENGRQCLQILSAPEHGSAKIDAVITDLFMPQMDGAELIVTIRGQIREPVPVIGMTGGYADAVRPYTQSLLKLGSDAVLAKPFTEQELTNTIDQLLGGGP